MKTFCNAYVCKKKQLDAFNKLALGSLALGASVLTNVLIAEKSHGAVLINATEDVSGVTFSYSGSLNINDLRITSNNISSGVGANVGLIVFGRANSSDLDAYSNSFSGPSNFGSGSFTSSTNASGDFFLVRGTGAALTVPDGYISDTLISGSMFFSGSSFSSLGIDDSQSYVWTINNTAADTITLQFEAEPIPEPLTIMGTLLAGGIGAIMKKRKD